MCGNVSQARLGNTKEPGSHGWKNLAHTVLLWVWRSLGRDTIGKLRCLLQIVAVFSSLRLTRPLSHCLWGLSPTKQVKRLSTNIKQMMLFPAPKPPVTSQHFCKRLWLPTIFGGGVVSNYTPPLVTQINSVLAHETLQDPAGLSHNLSQLLEPAAVSQT